MIPAGLCQCGCGERTKIAHKTDRKEGWVKGEPKRYVYGHRQRTATLKEERWCEEDRGYLTPCWIWLLRISVDGYGHTTRHYKTYRAHRLMYEDKFGAVPEGMHLDHLCRVRACVNPDHLEVVTPLENVRRQASTKLTIEVARAIRVSTERTTDLAERYGVSPQTISSIRHNPERWREAA